MENFNYLDMHNNDSIFKPKNTNHGLWQIMEVFKLYALIVGYRGQTSHSSQKMAFFLMAKIIQTNESIIILISMEYLNKVTSETTIQEDKCKSPILITNHYYA